MREKARDRNRKREREPLPARPCHLGREAAYRGISLIRNTPLLGPCGRTIQGPMVVLGGGLFLMSEVPLYWAGAGMTGSGCMYQPPGKGYLPRS